MWSLLTFLLLSILMWTMQLNAESDDPGEEENPEFKSCKRLDPSKYLFKKENGIDNYKPEVFVIRECNCLFEHMNLNTRANFKRSSELVPIIEGEWQGIGATAVSLIDGLGSKARIVSGVVGAIWYTYDAVNSNPAATTIDEAIERISISTNQQMEDLVENTNKKAAAIEVAITKQKWNNLVLKTTDCQRKKREPILFEKCLVNLYSDYRASLYTFTTSVSNAYLMDTLGYVQLFAQKFQQVANQTLILYKLKKDKACKSNATKIICINAVKTFNNHVKSMTNSISHFIKDFKNISPAITIETTPNTFPVEEAAKNIHASEKKWLPKNLYTPENENKLTSQWSRTVDYKDGEVNGYDIHRQRWWYLTPLTGFGAICNYRFGKSNKCTVHVEALTIKNNNMTDVMNACTITMAHLTEAYKKKMNAEIRTDLTEPTEKLINTWSESKIALERKLQRIDL